MGGKNGACWLRGELTCERNLMQSAQKHSEDLQACRLAAGRN